MCTDETKTTWVIVVYLGHKRLLFALVNLGPVVAGMDQMMVFMYGDLGHSIL